MDKFIVELPNFIPPKLCERIIERFENSDNKTNGGTYGCWSFNKYVIKKKYNIELGISRKKGWEDIENEIRSYIIKAKEMYDFNLFKKYNYSNQEYHPLDMVLKRDWFDHGLLVHKIEKDNKYEWHIDSEPGDSDYIQMIIYLNTVDKGGRTFLVSEKHGGIKPEIGKILIFPCSWTFPHTGEILGDDVKYILTVILSHYPRQS
jgi:hypothetical protein